MWLNCEEWWCGCCWWLVDPLGVGDDADADTDAADADVGRVPVTAAVIVVTAEDVGPSSAPIV